MHDTLSHRPRREGDDHSPEAQRSNELRSAALEVAALNAMFYAAEDPQIVQQERVNEVAAHAAVAAQQAAHSVQAVQAPGSPEFWNTMQDTASAPVEAAPVQPEAQFNTQPQPQVSAAELAARQAVYAAHAAMPQQGN